MKSRGTPPIVSNVGGLADSVVDCTPESIANGTGNGFKFTQYTSDATYFPLVMDLMVMALQVSATEFVRPVDNVFVGSGGRVVTYRDQGIGTRITGYAAMTGGAGEILHDTLTEAMPPAP